MKKMNWLPCHTCGRAGCLVLVMVSVFMSTLFAQTSKTRISVGEARRLVAAAIEVHDPYRQVEVSPVENRYDSFFMYFEATWPNPEGSPHLGNYAVNPLTGDVYNADGCERLQSSTLKKLQTHIRRRLSTKGEEYLKATVRKPICGSEP